MLISNCYQERKAAASCQAGKEARSQHQVLGNWSDKACKLQGKLTFQRVSKERGGESPFVSHQTPSLRWAVLCHPLDRGWWSLATQRTPGDQRPGEECSSQQQALCVEGIWGNGHSVLGFLQLGRQNGPSSGWCPNTARCPVSQSQADTISLAKKSH